MDFQATVTSLKPGDILLTEDKNHHFFKHVAVVTQVDQQLNDCKVAHWRGSRYPNALSETSLPSEELLQESNLAIHVFRLKDQNLAQRAAALLQKWCLWAIPFDKTRFQQAEQYNNRFLGIESEILNEKMPIILDRALFNTKMQENLKVLNEKFREHYLDIVKCALRQGISPVRPAPENQEKQKGFHGMQGILIAFQVACVENIIKPKNTKWFSNKENTPFKPVNKTLKSNFDRMSFLHSIPPAFQLWAKCTSIDTFHFALRNDCHHVVQFGVLAPQNPIRACDFDKCKYENITLAYQIGLKRRGKLLDEVILPGSQKTEDLKTKLYRKMSFISK